MYAYKVRDRLTGLYLRKGDDVSWSKDGAVWPRFHHLMAALRSKRKNGEIKANWELVIFNEPGSINADILAHIKEIKEKDVLDMLADKQEVAEQTQFNEP